MDNIISSTVEVEKSVSTIFQEIKCEMCDYYCKYPDIYDTREDSDEEFDKMFKEVCDSCPLNRL